MAEQRGGRPISASQRPTGGDKAMATKKQYFRRKKVCRFCVERIDDINYKDVRLLSSFIAERGKIVPRRISGVCAPHQRRLSDAIKKARNIALLPFSAAAEEASMEVILREDIDNLGIRGQMVKVAAGYARNYLLPKKLAVAATESNKKIVEQERQAFLRRETKEVADATDLGKMMANLSVTISQKAGENEQLFGSVTSKDIADALEKQGY